MVAHQVTLVLHSIAQHLDGFRQLNEVKSINSDNYCGVPKTSFVGFILREKQNRRQKVSFLTCPLHKGMYDCVHREEGIMCGGSSGASMAAAVKAAATLKVQS